MTPADVAAGLLAEFDAAGVALHVVDGRLRAWPSAAITPEVRAIIEPHRAELVAAVIERDAVIGAIEANAAPASATVAPTVAPMAPIAVAPAPLTGAELRLILAALDAHGATDAAERWRVLDDAQANAASRTWWIEQVSEADSAQAARDDRRICAECAHYRNSGHCANWRAAGYLRPVRVAAGGPLARCAGYAPVRTA